MANSIPKKRAKTEQLRLKRAQAAVLAQGAKTPPKAIPMRYPIKRAALGKRQAPGGGV